MAIIVKVRMVKIMNDENKIDLISVIYRLISAVFKTWKIGLVLVIVCCLWKVPSLWKSAPAMYETKVTFSVIKDYNGTSSFTYNKAATDKLANSFLTIINSDLMVNAICQDMNVSYIPATFRVERIKSTNLFSVYASSSDPQAAKATLDSLLKNYTQISKVALNDATLTVIEEPILPTTPINQNISMMSVVKGGILGIAIYGIVVLGYVFLRKTFAKESDIVYYLHSKCLGSIGNLKAMKKGKTLLINKDIESSRNLKEAFRKIRLAIENDHDKYHHQVYLLTSTLANEGKSMIASNLALSLALKNKKVLLIDFDLRSPTQFKTFNLDKEKHVHEYVINNSLLHHYQQVETNFLDIIVSSEGNNNASEVLSNPDIEKLIKNKRSEYDYIIIDTPPIHLMADASIASKYADTSIMVVKEDYATIDEAREAMMTLKNTNIEVLGCILNQVKHMPFFSSKYGYGYGYGYYRYNKYHYQSKKDD